MTDCTPHGESCENHCQAPVTGAATDCRGGDYCDEVCPGPGQCGPAPATVPGAGTWLVIDGVARRVTAHYAIGGDGLPGVTAWRVTTRDET
jgi:hypothetical protein